MIKIKLEDRVRRTIQEEHFKDISSSKVFKTFLNSRLSKYEELYNYLFCNSGEIDQQKLKKLIIGNKNDLTEIIGMVGKVPIKKGEVFDQLYTNFTNRKWSKILLEKLNVRVCPYCNRQYTFTLHNDGIRPQFDHFYPKSLYPYLSVSLYNLIPSCSICNLKKHALDTYDSLNDFYYPYEDEFGDNVVFQTYPLDNDFLYWLGLNSNFEIKLVSKDNKNINKINNLNKYLKIELLYKEHKDYVRDIIRNSVINNKSRIDELLEEFPDIFSSEIDVINALYMSDVDKDSWGERPLSKLTHDIYKEFNIFE